MGHRPFWIPIKRLNPSIVKARSSTDDGEVVSGLVLERNDRELLVGVSDGSIKTVPLESIEDEKSAGDIADARRLRAETHSRAIG